MAIAGVSSTTFLGARFLGAAFALGASSSFTGSAFSKSSGFGPSFFTGRRRVVRLGATSASSASDSATASFAASLTGSLTAAARLRGARAGVFAALFSSWSTCDSVAFSAIKLCTFLLAEHTPHIASNQCWLSWRCHEKLISRMGPLPAATRVRRTAYGGVSFDVLGNAGLPSSIGYCRTPPLYGPLAIPHGEQNPHVFRANFVSSARRTQRTKWRETATYTRRGMPRWNYTINLYSYSGGIGQVNQ